MKKHNFLHPASCLSFRESYHNLNDQLLRVHFNGVFFETQVARGTPPEVLDNLETALNSEFDFVTNYLVKDTNKNLAYQREVHNFLADKKIPSIMEFYTRTFRYDFVIGPSYELGVKEQIIIEVKQGKHKNTHKKNISQLLKYLHTEDLKEGWLLYNNDRKFERLEIDNKVIHIFGNLKQLDKWFAYQPKYTYKEEQLLLNELDKENREELKYWIRHFKNHFKTIHRY